MVSRFYTPPELKFHVFGTSKHEEEKWLAIEYVVLLYLAVYCGDFVEQIKKNLSYTPCFLESMAKPCLTRKCIVCGIILYAHFYNMASKTSRTTNFSEQGKLLLADLGRDFPEVESKGYDSKTLAKKGKGIGGKSELNLTPRILTV